jgi:hypothetical protein
LNSQRRPTRPGNLTVGVGTDAARTPIWGAALAVGAALFATEARANCAAPVGYEVTEAPVGKVEICLNQYVGRNCPDTGLLRRNVNGGQVVEITTCDGECFLDECVPAGTYQYGLAVPYACQSAACSTDYFEEAVITGAAAGCVPTVSAPEPASAVPWTTDQPKVCVYGGPDHDSSGCGVAPAGSVLGANLVLLLAGAVLWHRRAGRRTGA